jgi:hypothetical protein
MVESGDDFQSDSLGRGQVGTATGPSRRPVGDRFRGWRSILVVALTVVLATVAVGIFGQSGAAQTAGTSHPSGPSRHSTGIIDPQRGQANVVATPDTAPAVVPTTSPTPAAVQRVVDPTPAPVPVVPSAPVALPMTVSPTTTTPATGPSIAALVAEVEASGIDPGPTWTWTMGDPSTKCGTIQGSGGTGCTSGAAGSATTVFAGSPSLSLVAHEIANAETENYAVPALVAEVTGAEAGTSWSPIDAVASCLVEHFMGFQDNAAGSWQCPTDLATAVANGIR